MRSSFVSLCLALAGCAVHAEGNADVQSAASAQVELQVGDLHEGDDAKLREELAKVGGVRDVRIQAGRGTTTVNLTYDGCVCDLEDALASIEYPTLRVSDRRVTLVVNATDEKPPDVVFVFPDPDQEQTVVTEPEANVVVEVTDDSGEVSSVKIGGQDAQNLRGHVWQRSVTLREGQNAIEVAARDPAGNETNLEAKITLDTTPPALDAQIRIIVEGDVEAGSTVLINGETVDVDENGHYSHEVRVRRGMTEIEIHAIDPQGNRTVTVKSLTGG